MSPVVCLLQTTPAIELAKVKAWFQVQKLNYDIYDQAALILTVEAKSPLSQRLAAEQKVLSLAHCLSVQHLCAIGGCEPSLCRVCKLMSSDNL